MCVCQPTFWCDACTGPLEEERRSSASRISSNLRMDSSSASRTTLRKGCFSTYCITPFYCQLGLEPIPSTSPHSPRPAKHPGPSCGPKPHSTPSTTQPPLRLQSGSVCARPNFHEQVSTRCCPPAARCSLNHSAPQRPRLLGGESIDSEFRVYHVIGLLEERWKQLAAPMTEGFSARSSPAPERQCGWGILAFLAA